MPNDGQINSPEFMDAHTHARSGNSKTPSTPGRLGGLDQPLPPSNGSNIDPRYLLNHENHFDPNTLTPEQALMMYKLKQKNLQLSST
jgi:hypothetical protein